MVIFKNIHRVYAQACGYLCDLRGKGLVMFKNIVLVLRASLRLVIRFTLVYDLVIFYNIDRVLHRRAGSYIRFTLCAIGYF